MFVSVLLLRERGRCFATCWRAEGVHQKCPLSCSAGSYHVNVPVAYAGLYVDHVLHPPFGRGSLCE